MWTLRGPIEYGGTFLPRPQRPRGASAVVLFALSLAPPAGAEETRPQAAGAQEEESKPDPQAEEFRRALEVLGESVKPEELVRATEVLASGFPASRPLLHEAARGPNPRLRVFALRLLGERGTAEDDLEVVASGLRDADPKVRLAAVMAIRRLGPKGFDALVAYLPSEHVPNNLKMAVKTLEVWKVEEAIPYLVRVLERTTHRGVQSFTLRALRRLSGRDFGRDIEGWKEFAEDWQASKQAEALGRSLRARGPAEESRSAAPGKGE